MPDQALEQVVKSLKAVFIFGGDITPASDPSHLGGLGWRSLRGVETDKTGAMPSYERVQAAAVLHQINPKLILVPSGGRTNIGGASHGPPISSVMAAELRELGVPSGVIIEESVAFDTREQVVLCATIARDYGWGRNVAVLSLFIHFGRITAMMRHDGFTHEYTRSLSPDVTRFISVERALAHADAPRWNAYFKDLYGRPEMIPTLVGETLGTGQLWAGHSPAYPNPFRGFKDPLHT